MGVGVSEELHDDDELNTQLNPTWVMRIKEWLRRLWS